MDRGQCSSAKKIGLVTVTNVITVIRMIYLPQIERSERLLAGDGWTLTVTVGIQARRQASLISLAAILLIGLNRACLNDDYDGRDGAIHIYSALDFAAPTTRLMSWRPAEARG